MNNKYIVTSWCGICYVVQQFESLREALKYETEAFESFGNATLSEIIIHEGDIYSEEV